MKKNFTTLLVSFGIIFFALISSGCPQPGSGGSSDISDNSIIFSEYENIITPVMNIIDGTISKVSPEMEYSLNNKSTWISCTGSVVDVTFSIGNLVWVRDIGISTTEFFLGEVEALSGPDLIAGNRIYLGLNNWDDVTIASSGDIHKVKWYFENIGDSSAYSADHRIKIYLSTDKTITSDDTLILDFSYPYSCPVGSNIYGGTEEFTVPSVTPGVYYVGAIIDATGVIDELNESNNVTLPEDTAEFIIKDNTPVPAGAFKFVNSWGDWSTSWENIADGHYWVSYNTMKKQEMMVNYYYNNFSNVYEPTVVAVFQLTHSERNKCKVILGLGDPSDPYMVKELQSRWLNTIQSGSLPFPSNDIVLDISEFASAINDYDLFLKIENSSAITGSIVNFSVEFYSDYDIAPFETITGGTAAIPANDSVIVTAITDGVLSYTEMAQIIPLSRSIISGTSFIEEKPDKLEFNRDIQSAGIYEPGKNYNKIVYDGFGTGYQPPTEEEWSRMKKLRSVESSVVRGELPTSIDHSITQYFPPIGSQGSEGSCTAFSFGYYIQTYTEAKEHGWDLSGTSWLETDPSGLSSAGIPDSNLDKIFSPDFIYHQINDGVDLGSNGGSAATLITRVGGATWEEMPYNTGNSTSWPSESAWRESGRYRGREVSNQYWDFSSSGYFIIYDDSDINLLKSLLANGYCVNVSIRSESPGGLYDLLDEYDVVDNDTANKMSTDHAQTIVGYKEGSSWNPLNPDS